MVSLILLTLIAGPKIEVDKTSHDFGMVKEGEVAVHIFKIRNVGDKDLEIKDIRTSCGCTAALLSDKTISPGKTAEIKVTYDSRGRPGKFRKTITLYSNAENQNQLTLSVYGEVVEGEKPKGYTNPGFKDLGEVEMGNEILTSFYLHSTGKIPLIVNEIITTQGIQVLPWEKDTLNPGDSLEIKVKITPNTQERFDGVVIVKTNDPNLPQKFFRVQAKVK